MVLPRPLGDARALLLVLTALSAARALRPLPKGYERASGLVLRGDGPHPTRRRLTAHEVLDDIQESLHVSFTTPSRSFSMELHRAEVWGPDAQLIVNSDGESRSLVPPKLPAYRGRLSNQSSVGGGVSGVVLADGTLRVHVYEDGEDLILESADHFDTGATSFDLGDHIIFRDTSQECGANGECSTSGTTVCGWYALSPCDKSFGNTCKEHCTYSGTCHPLANLIAPASGERQLKMLERLLSGDLHGGLHLTPSAPEASFSAAATAPTTVAVAASLVSLWHACLRQGCVGRALWGRWAAQVHVRLPD